MKQPMSIADLNALNSERWAIWTTRLSSYLNDPLIAHAANRLVQDELSRIPHPGLQQTFEKIVFACGEHTDKIEERANIRLTSAINAERAEQQNTVIREISKRASKAGRSPKPDLLTAYIRIVCADQPKMTAKDLIHHIKCNWEAIECIKKITDAEIIYMSVDGQKRLSTTFEALKFRLSRAKRL